MKNSFQNKCKKLDEEIRLRLTFILRTLAEPSSYNSDMYGLAIDKTGVSCDYDEIFESYNGIMLQRDGYSYSLSCLDMDKLCELADKATEYAESTLGVKFGVE